MRQPQVGGFGVVSQHAHAVFDQPVEFIKQMRVHPNTGSNSKKTKSREAIEIAIVNPSHGDSPGGSRKQSFGGPCWSQWQPEIMRHGIGGTKWNDSQRRVFTGKTLEHIVDGTVASASHDSIESFANRHADLRRGVGGGTSRRDIDFNPSRLQNGLDGFDIRQPVLSSASRDGIVEKGDSAHAKGLYRVQCVGAGYRS